MKRIFTQQEITKIMNSYCEPNNLSYQEIADNFGVKKRVIVRLIDKSFLHKDTSGENNGNHVLVKEDVVQMRKMYLNSDMSYQDIANEYGISKSTALRAIKGESWKCIS